MNYKYAANVNFEHLAAGAVIKSYKGNTNFPVRLGHEIFNRCLEYIDTKNKITIYDPMCGSGYLLTTIGILNFEKISMIYASDANQDVLLVAEKNLRLLTKNGIQERQKEIEISFEKFNRQSYSLSLEYIKSFKDIVDWDLSYNIFERDIFINDVAVDFKADIVIMDLPYNNLVNYNLNYSPTALEDQILNLIQNHKVVAVIRNKSQKVSLTTRAARKEKFKVGNRMIEIFSELNRKI